MHRLKRQEGSTLILLIGIVAALSIMAASMLMLTSNVAHNTSQDRSKTSSFDIAEAALDRGMYTLGSQWPVSASPTPSFSASAFLNDFPASSYPSPVSGPRVWVQFVDNQNPIDYSIHYDMGQPGLPTTPDKRMYVIVQAGTGQQATRLMALVRMENFPITVPHGVALYAGGSLLSNGGGNNPKITVEVPPPPDASGSTKCNIHVGGTIDTTTVVDAGQYNPPVNNDPTNINDVFPDSLVAALTSTAAANGREFNSQAAAEASPVNGQWSPWGGMTGLTVIHASAGTTVSFKANYNTEAKPGIIMVLGGGGVDFGGNGDFYGIVYTQGPVDKGHGTYTIHGMLVTTSTDDMRGTVNLMYNDTCIANLMASYTLNVHVEPNTWRELPPLPTASLTP